MGDFSYYIDHVHFVVPILGAFLGLIHLTVLTRKCMRTLGINIFLIGIAIADMIRSISINFTPFFYLRYLSNEVLWFDSIHVFYSIRETLQLISKLNVIL